MKEYIENSNPKDFLQPTRCINKPCISQVKQRNWTYTSNLQPLQEQQIMLSEISSVARKDVISVYSESQITPKEPTSQDSSPIFTVNSQLFGQSHSSHPISSSSSNTPQISNPTNKQPISDSFLQFVPSKIVKDYKKQQQQRRLQQKLRKQQKNQYGQSNYATIQLRNRLRNLKNWIKEGKDNKNKCNHFKKADVFSNLMSMKKKENEQQKRINQHYQYVRDHPPSKLCYYKHLLNQEGICFSQAKKLVDKRFPNSLKIEQDLVFNRSVTNEQISKNGHNLITNLRQGNLTKRPANKIDYETHIFEKYLEGSNKKASRFEGNQSPASNEQSNIDQVDQVDSENQITQKNENQPRRFRQIRSEPKNIDSKHNQQINYDLDQLQKQIYPKRTAKSYMKNSIKDDEQIFKKRKVSENYYFASSGIDSQSDTRNTPWSKFQFKPLSKLPPISEAEQSLPENGTQM